MVDWRLLYNQSRNPSVLYYKKKSDAKQETRTKFLTELQKCNELQKERNSILQKQLKILERIENKIYPTQKKLSDEEL